MAPAEQELLEAAAEGVSSGLATALDWLPEIGGLLRCGHVLLDRKSQFNDAMPRARQTARHAALKNPPPPNPHPARRRRVDGAGLCGAPAGLRFSLPPPYPLDPGSPARLSLDCAAPRALHDALCRELQGMAAGEWAGAPCLLLAAGWLQVGGAGWVRLAI